MILLKISMISIAKFYNFFFEDLNNHGEIEKKNVTLHVTISV